jgi:predicted nucleic acid-binding protein
MYLLDTNVVSELRKVASGKADANLVTWAEAIETNQLYISAITVLELERGVLQIERRDERQGAMLRQWLDGQVLPAFSDRILPITTDIARACARLHVPDPRSERDALIAATALVHNLSVVTRNTADFANCGIALVNPWDSQPALSL